MVRTTGLRLSKARMKDDNSEPTLLLPEVAWVIKYSNRQPEAAVEAQMVDESTIPSINLAFGNKITTNLVTRRARRMLVSEF